MAEVPSKIEEIIKEYIKTLRQNKIPIKNAFLFGSFVRGTHNEWSDIDIALVSDIFEGNRINDKSKIRKLILSVSSSLEVHPFNTIDFNDNNPLVKEIIETGIKLV